MNKYLIFMCSNDKQETLELTFGLGGEIFSNDFWKHTLQVTKYKTVILIYS